MSFMKNFNNVEIPTYSNFLTVDHDANTQTIEVPSSKTVEITSIMQLDCRLLPETPARSSVIGSVGEIHTNIQPNFSGKRKKRDEVPSPIDMAILAELSGEKNNKDTLYMKSLVPQLKRLNDETKAFVKCQIQQLLFKAEYGKSFQEE